MSCNIFSSNSPLHHKQFTIDYYYMIVIESNSWKALPITIIAVFFYISSVTFGAIVVNMPRYEIHPNPKSYYF